MKTLLRRKRLYLGIFLILLLVLFISSVDVVISNLYSNAGSVLLIKVLFSENLQGETRTEILNKSQTFFITSLDYDPSNKTNYRGLGWIHHLKGEKQKAVDHWEKLGWTGRDFIQKGDHHQSQGEYEQALTWYDYALMEGQGRISLWIKVGKSCQNIYFHGDLCQRVLEKNGHNMILNSSFQEKMEGWKSHQKPDVGCEIETCPGDKGLQCAHMMIEGDVPAHGAGCWNQCLRIIPGETYQFAADLKVSLDGSGRWRPLYHQGDIDGQPRGNWPGYQTDSSQWSHWEKTFTAGTYDQNWVCFYPVLLEGKGEAWFGDVVLRRIPEK